MRLLLLLFPLLSHGFYVLPPLQRTSRLASAFWRLPLPQRDGGGNTRTLFHGLSCQGSSQSTQVRMHTP